MYVQSLACWVVRRAQITGSPHTSTSPPSPGASSTPTGDRRSLRLLGWRLRPSRFTVIIDAVLVKLADLTVDVLVRDVLIDVRVRILLVFDVFVCHVFVRDVFVRDVLVRDVLVRGVLVQVDVAAIIYICTAHLVVRQIIVNV